MLNWVLLNYLHLSSKTLHVNELRCAITTNYHLRIVLKCIFLWIGKRMADMFLECAGNSSSSLQNVRSPSTNQHMQISTGCWVLSRIRKIHTMICQKQTKLKSFLHSFIFTIFSDIYWRWRGDRGQLKQGSNVTGPIGGAVSGETVNYV